MSHYFDKTEYENQLEHRFKTAVAIFIPRNHPGPVEQIHLLKSKEIQSTWNIVEASREFIEDNYDVITRPTDDFSSYTLIAYCWINGHKHQTPPIGMLRTDRITLADRQLWSSVSCGTCRGRYLFELRKRGDEDRAKALETLWLEIHAEIADCTNGHRLEPAANHLLACRKCGRYHRDIGPNDTSYFAGGIHKK